MKKKKTSAVAKKRPVKPAKKKVAAKKPAPKKVVAKKPAKKVAPATKKKTVPAKKKVVVKPVKKATAPKKKVAVAKKKIVAAPAKKIAPSAKKKVAEAAEKVVEPKKQVAAVKKKPAVPVKKVVVPEVKPDPIVPGWTKVQFEYYTRSSVGVLYSSVSNASGLSAWFADYVDSMDNLFTFKWDSSEESAVLVEKEENEYVRFRWLTQPKDCYFEFRIKIDGITNEVALIVTVYVE
ncbi:MAG: START-like domain-containing protein [Bacteriovoracia bacterium]